MRNWLSRGGIGCLKELVVTRKLVVPRDGCRARDGCSNCDALSRGIGCRGIGCKEKIGCRIGSTGI